MKLPPYGKNVLKLRESGVLKTLYVFADYFYNASRYCKNSTDSMVCPYWEEPDSFQWPVTGHDVIVFFWVEEKFASDHTLKNFHYKYAKKLGLCLALAGAKKVVLYALPYHERIFIQGGN